MGRVKGCLLSTHTVRKGPVPTGVTPEKPYITLNMHTHGSRERQTVLSFEILGESHNERTVTLTYWYIRRLDLFYNLCTASNFVFQF